MNHVALLKSRFKNHGGLEKYASRIAKAFQEKGAKVSILTTGKGHSSLNMPIFSCQTVPWPAFVRMEQFDWFVRDWLKKNKVDLVFGMDRNRFQTHMRAGNGVHAAYLKSRLFTDPLLKALCCHINPLHRKILSLEKAAFEHPHLQMLFTNSEMVKNQVLQYYSTDPKKIKVVHNGVEWHEMERDFANWQEAKKQTQQKHFLDPNQFHFLFIGNGYSRKGLNQLLVALSQMKEEPFHLSVLGKDNKIDLYKAKAIQLGLKDRVRFFGSQEDIRPFYQMADALLIPSFYDPFANVTVEALAMGLYVVSSRQNGGSEIIAEDNGTVIEDLLDPDAIKSSLKKALQHKKTLLNSQKIRNSVKYLDFSNQMRTLVEACG